MASKITAQEILKLIGLEDKELIESVSSQVSQVAKHLGVADKEVPEKFREMLTDLEVSYGSKGFHKYLEERAEWMKANKDLLMLTYDIETNWRFSKIRRGDRE